MIEQLLPAGTAVAESVGDPAAGELYPVEEAAMRCAATARRLEFADARACARRALGQLGVPPCPIPQAADRVPVWPAGSVGSITHCAGYRGAAAARGARLAALGIDAEPAAALLPELVEIVCCTAERRHLADLAGSFPGVPWDKVIFSMKESVYKAWYPLTSKLLGFEDVRITVDPVGHGFEAELLMPAEHPCLATGRIAGRWTVTGGLVLTAVAVPTAVGVVSFTSSTQ